MQLKMDREKLKFAGGALVIAGAAVIVMPGLFGYVAGLWRLGLWVLVAIATAWVLSFIWARFAVSRQGKGN